MAPEAPSISPQWLRLAGWLAILGAVVGMAGDYCLLFSPEGGYLSGNFDFMANIHPQRIRWGHYLGILAIPLQAAGFLLLWQGLRPLGSRTAGIALGLGLYAMFLGVCYHGTVYPLAAQVGEGANPETLRPFSEPLGLGFALLFVVLVLLLTVAILRGKTAWPKHYAWASPLLTYGLVLVTYIAVPLLGNFLAPMGFNLSMAVFFAVLLQGRGRAWH